MQRVKWLYIRLPTLLLQMVMLFQMEAVKGSSQLLHLDPPTCGHWVSPKLPYKIFAFFSQLFKCKTVYSDCSWKVESILFSCMCGQFISIIYDKDDLNKTILLIFLTSPAEELYFGSKETGEKKCLIVLTNVTKNVVAFKVNILSVTWFTLWNV